MDVSLGNPLVVVVLVLAIIALLIYILRRR